MPRSRADIEADIADLQAELDATQPDVLAVPQKLWPGRNVRFKCDFFNGKGIYVAVEGANGTGRPNRLISSASAAELRDWLNYHFPKTEENS